MGIIHNISFHRRRCCFISGYQNVLISLTLELFKLVTRTRQYVFCFSMPLQCCVLGCSNLEVGYTFSKDLPKKLKWTVAITRHDPSIKRVCKTGQSNVIVNAVSTISDRWPSTNTLYPIRATSFVSIVLTLCLQLTNELQKY